MSAPPAVRLAERSENDAVSEVLTDAFVDEAGLNYWLRQGERKERARRQFFDAAVRYAVNPKRDLYVAEADGQLLGAALWLAPGLKAFDFPWWREILMAPLFISIAGAEGMKRATALGEKLATYHPKASHAHLSFLGVSSKAQGRGVGSEMLKQTLAPLDRSKTVAYLEASTERNVALYARHGFEVTGEFELPNLRFWCMTRRPRF